MIAHIQRKVRRLRLAVDRDVIQHAAKLSVRRQDAADALDRVQVRVAEAVASVERRLARIVYVPRPEMTRRMHLANRLRIDQLRLIRKRLPAPTSCRSSF